MERGAASIRVELSTGYIRVFHGTDGTLLAVSPEPVAEGSWDRLWEALTALGVVRVGEVGQGAATN